MKRRRTESVVVNGMCMIFLSLIAFAIHVVLTVEIKVKEKPNPEIRVRGMQVLKKNMKLYKETPWIY